MSKKTTKKAKRQHGTSASKKLLELPLPEEVHDLFLEGYAARECRDKAIKSVWTARRAVGYAKQSLSAFDKAWRLVVELYPQEYESCKLEYKHARRVLECSNAKWSGAR